MARFKEPDRSVPVRWRGSLDGLLPEDHMARFVWDVLCSLDFSEIEATYPSVQTGRGRPPFHPRLLAALWIYAMLQGIETAAGIAEACVIRDDFKWLAGGLTPCDQTMLNFVTRAIGVLPALWKQLLLAMQDAGLVDLSLVAEDGTKVRVNASPRSFRTSDKIRGVVDELSRLVEVKLAELAENPTDATDRKTAAQIAGIRGRLVRAKRAKEAVDERVRRRTARAPARASREANALKNPGSLSGDEPLRNSPRFDRSHFHHDAEHDELECPGGHHLRFIGEYDDGSSRGPYRLYGRRNCVDCPLKERCTKGRGRRVKVPLEPPAEVLREPESEVRGDGSASKRPTATDADVSQPTASITEPESSWMKATSRKRWEPSFNADIAVTRDGIIVSQFLSTENNDYHFFEPALRFVLDTLGKPDMWVGDGHYSTAANIVLASREGVLLYAPRAAAKADIDTTTTDEKSEASRPKKKQRRDAKYRAVDFTLHPDKEAVVCPAGEELRYVGEYPTDNKRCSYRLYRRLDCTGCQLKHRCTSARGRSAKIPNRKPHARGPPKSARAIALEDAEAAAIAEAVRAHDARMRAGGKEIAKTRGHLSESANAHLHQHGLRRFHVRGFVRCGAVLTLACMAHNIRKWALLATTERVLMASK